MIKGETLLVDCGLARRIGSLLVPSGALLSLQLEDENEAAGEITAHALAQLPPTASGEQLAQLVEAAIPSAERREELLLALGAKFDDTHARLVGEIGEEIVVEASRNELLALGHPELASRVRRVSLGSDALGYDVTAPRSTGSQRLFEVKSSVRVGEAEFFLSRNEWETGVRFADDWFLIYCMVSDTDTRTGGIVGWCEASLLSDHVPFDQGSGKWSSVHVALSTSRLETGLPR
jgi:hypothetical protein